MLTNISTSASRAASKHVGRAEHVGLPGLRRVLLEHRQVLQRRGVEHHLRAMRVEDSAQGLRIADVSEDDVVGVEHAVAGDAQLQGVQRGLVTVEHQQLRRVEADQLPAKLRADRAARAGDQHPLAGDVAGGGCHIGVHRLAAEQVGDVDVAQVAQADLAVEDLVAGWAAP